jgi:hypothetical protein
VDIRVRSKDDVIFLSKPAEVVDNLDSSDKGSTESNIDIHNQLAEPSRDAKVYVWKGLRFRSQREVRIAEELDRRRVLFFPNCKARLGLKERQNREPDFFICYEGKWGILEVDGGPHHPPTRTVGDHERDRLFHSYGILLVEHFDAGECWDNADGVVRNSWSY